MRWDSKYAYEVPGKLEIPFRYFAGKTGSEFLTSLRDHKKVLGSKCGTCGGVMVPPRSLCDKCQQPTQGLVEVGPGGVVTAMTVVRYEDPHLPLRPPYILANIKLDGADTALTHIVAGAAPSEVKIGARVGPVWSEDRKARITDIAYFRPEASGLTEEIKDKVGAAAKAVDQAARAAKKKALEVIKDSEPAAKNAKKKVEAAVKDGEKMAQSAVKAVEEAARTVEKKIRQVVKKAQAAAKPKAKKAAKAAAKPVAKKTPAKKALPKAKPAAKKAAVKKAAPKKAVVKKAAVKKAAAKKAKSTPKKPVAPKATAKKSPVKKTAAKKPAKKAAKTATKKTLAKKKKR